MINSTYSLNFKHAYPSFAINGNFKSQPSSFKVTELRHSELSGTGEHVWLHWRKTGLNTQALVRDLAKLANVKDMDVGYAGLKDRQAITSQWFSVYLPTETEPDWSSLESEKLQLLEATRHTKKLRRGQHDGNGFVIDLTSIEGDTAALQQKLETIKKYGVPNYFGSQRFGINAGNLVGANALFNKSKRPNTRHLRNLYISAARSYIFNKLLSKRIENNTWQVMQTGDIPCDTLTPMPTGALWGRGRLQSSGNIIELETAIAAELTQWCRGLEHCGLKQERRSLCLPVKNFDWLLQGDNLQLSFELAPGGYATSVIREIGDFVDLSRVFTQKYEQVIKPDNIGEIAN